MTSEKLSPHDATCLCFTSLVDEKKLKSGAATNTDDKNTFMLDKVPKHRPASVIERVFDSLNVSPKLRGNLRKALEKPLVESRRTEEDNGRSTSGHLAPENRKHAAVWPSYFHSFDTTETCDSSSDSAYSQYSDTSDLRSQNATSTYSENNRIFKQGIAHKDRASLNNNIDAINVDNAFLRRVVMLMKVILYLRHSFPINIFRKRKVSAKNASNHIKFRDSSSLSSCESGDSHDSGIFNTKSPRTRKRISFSPITLLFSAITERACDEAKAIMEEQEPDVNYQTPNGQSLLHIAAANADLKCVQLLLQNGADVNVKDTDGWGPLHAAVTRGNWKCAILLIEAGADFGEYAQARIQEYNQVQQVVTKFVRSVEIYV